MSDCNNCEPGIECIHINKGTGPAGCPWWAARPPDGVAPRGSTMLLRITGAEGADWVQLRLVCTFTREGGVLYENWTAPDFPLPQPMISEILTFLEQHVCAPVSQDRAITKAEVPASLIMGLMGPAWMSQFRQLVSTPTPAPKQVEFRYQDAGIDIAYQPAPADGTITEAEYEVVTTSAEKPVREISGTTGPNEITKSI